MNTPVIWRLLSCSLGVHISEVSLYFFSVNSSVNSYFISWPLYSHSHSNLLCFVLKNNFLLHIFPRDWRYRYCSPSIRPWCWDNTWYAHASILRYRSRAAWPREGSWADGGGGQGRPLYSSPLAGHGTYDIRTSRPLHGKLFQSISR